MQNNLLKCCRWCCIEINWDHASCHLMTNFYALINPLETKILIFVILIWLHFRMFAFFVHCFDPEFAETIIFSILTTLYIHSSLLYSWISAWLNTFEWLLWQLIHKKLLLKSFIFATYLSEFDSYLCTNYNMKCSGPKKAIFISSFSEEHNLLT